MGRHFKRVVNRFLLWGPPASGSAYGLVLVIVGTAAPANADAKTFLANQFTMLRAMTNAPYILAWLLGLGLLWLFAFLSSLEHDAVPVQAHSHNSNVVVWVVEKVRNIFHKDIPAETKPVASLSTTFIPGPGLFGEGTANAAELAGRPHDRDVALHAGLSYAVFGDWFARSDAVEAAHSGEFESALERFHELALADRLQSWGRPFSILQTNHFRPIPPAHWNGYDVDFMSAMLAQSSSTMNLGGMKGFNEIMVNRAQFESGWPHGK